MSIEYSPDPVLLYDLGYDNADQLLTAPLKRTTNNTVVRQYTYGYDLAAIPDLYLGFSR